MARWGSCANRTANSVSDDMPSIGLSEPPAPGVRFWVDVPAGCTALGTMPPPDGQGFTTDFNGDRWRAVLRSATGDLDSGWSLEFEIEGRYAEDLRS